MSAGIEKVDMARIIQCDSFKLLILNQLLLLEKSRNKKRDI